MAITDAVIASSGLHVNAMTMGEARWGSEELVLWNEHAIWGKGGWLQSRVKTPCSGLSIGVVTVSHRSSTAWTCRSSGVVRAGKRRRLMSSQ